MKICTDIAPILIKAAITIDAARKGMNIEIRSLGKDAPMALAAKGDGVGWICVALGMSRGNQQGSRVRHQNPFFLVFEP